MDLLSEIPRPANQTYFPALDGIRAMAFLMVFGLHYAGLPWGWTGVDIFFVLSGFLITGILFDTRNQPHKVRNFYVRRTLRIFPLYYGIMLLLVLTYPFFRWDWNWAWLAWPAYLGNFLRGLHPLSSGSPLQMLADFQPLSRTIHGFQLDLGHFWSLCVEEQFYLVWPWVVFAVRDRKRLLRICLVSLVVCPLLRLAGAHLMLDPEILYRWTPFRIDSLLMGGAIALAIRGERAKQLLQASRPCFAVMFSAMVIWLAFSSWSQRGALGYAYPSWKFTWGLVFVDAFSACLILMALQPGSLIFHIFNFRPMRWLGRISYGAYVFHLIPHHEISLFVAERHMRHPELSTVAIALCITLLTSWISFRWFETPFIRLKERWTRTLPGPLKQKAMAQRA
jgi:peptidoglycan/LPS O-acetylase OafA/YrhL